MTGLGLCAKAGAAVSTKATTATPMNRRERLKAPEWYHSLFRAPDRLLCRVHHVPERTSLVRGHPQRARAHTPWNAGKERLRT